VLALALVVVVLVVDDHDHEHEHVFGHVFGHVPPSRVGARDASKDLGLAGAGDWGRS
jgi:hypothetical protein